LKSADFFVFTAYRFEPYQSRRKQMFPEKEIESEDTDTVDAPPSQEVESAQEIVTNTPPSGSEASLTQTPAGQPAAEDKPVVEETSETASEALSQEGAPPDYDKALGRKFFMEVQKMGGERVFEASRKMSTTFFNDSPENFVSEIEQYGQRYFPVRDQIVHSVIAAQPERLLEILKQSHPQLFKETQSQPPPQSQTSEQSFSLTEWAESVINDEYANEVDKQAARRALAMEAERRADQEKLGKLPEIEQKLSRFEQSFSQTQAQRVEEQTAKYVDGLMTVVDAAYTKSGLEKSGIDIDTFRNLVTAAHGKDAAANAKFVAALDAIKAGDMQTALLLQEDIQRDGEKIAFNYARQFSGAQSQRREQTGQLQADKNRMLPAGVAPPMGNRIPNAPAFDEANYQGGMQDIIERTP
jgi:hypothetical protein